MYYGIIIELKLTRRLPETELNALIGDLNSFRKHAVVRGKLRGMPNYIWNIYDETDFDEKTSTFGGELRIYTELENRNDLPVDDIKLICDHYEVAITQLIRKWLV